MPSSMDDTMVPEANIGIDSVSTMDEIELDIVDDAMASEFGAEDEFKDQDEEGEDGDLLSTEALAEDEEAQDDDDDDDEDE